MKQTIFKRRKDNVLFYLWFPTTTSTKAEFRTSIYDDLDTERYAMDEVIRNHKEFEFIDGEQEINHCWTAKLGNEIVRVNNWGELIHSPKVDIGRSYALKAKPTGRVYKIVSIGSWDEDAKAYRLIYYGGKNHEGCGLDTDFNV